MFKRIAFCAAVSAVAMAGSALAGEERKCSEQFGLEEHLVLEWAALGGDPQAQYSIGQCAFPTSAAEPAGPEKIYALKWLTLASCDGSPNAERDRMTRRLKSGSNISFRRFGGITGDETWTRQEKKLIEMRDAQIADLNGRLARLKAKSSEQELVEARDQLADQFARMGPMGLLRLTEMTSCKEFAATDSYSAAVWSAAATAWSRPEVTSVYGASVQSDWDLKREAEKRVAALSKVDRRRMGMEKDALLSADPARLAALEDAAALGRLEKLGFASAGSEGLEFSGRATTTAIQYALESLGFIEFVNGPDNDYGPSTIEAARKAQAAYGKQETRFLAPEEIRQVVCDAAVKKADPVSYYHLGMMYSEGMGFKKNVNLARIAIAKAEEHMAERLMHESSLPDWKRRAYPEYQVKISAAKAVIEDSWTALPKHVQQQALGAESICR
jgi:TPR repeat protein